MPCSATRLMFWSDWTFDEPLTATAFVPLIEMLEIGTPMLGSSENACTVASVSASMMSTPPPVVAYEDVTVACGHVERFGLFEDKKDKFRADRRKKLIGRVCKACRAQREREEQEAAEQRRAERAKNTAAQERKRPKMQKRQQVSRLPDQSGFEVRYHAATETWSGTLTVPVDGVPNTFTASASGVFTLLSMLDTLYRATQPAPAPEQANGTAPYDV